MRIILNSIFLLILIAPLIVFGQNNKDTNLIPSTGTIIIQSDIDNAEIYMNNIFIGTTPDTLHNLKFNRQYEFIIKKDNYRSVTKRVTIYKYRPTSKIYAIIGYSKLLAIGNPQNAILTIDNEITSKFPTDTLMLVPGEHLININKDGYYKYKKIYDLKSETFSQIDIKLTPKSKTRSFIYSAAFPGLGQYYSDQDYKGLAFGGSEILSLILVNNYNNKIKSQKSEYNRTYILYLQSTNTDLVNSYHRKLKKIENDLNSNKNIRDISLICAISIWTLNLIDIYFWQPPKFVTENMSINLKNDSSQGLNTTFIQITCKL